MSEIEPKTTITMSVSEDTGPIVAAPARFCCHDDAYKAALRELAPLVEAARVLSRSGTSGNMWDVQNKYVTLTPSTLALVKESTA